MRNIGFAGTCLVLVLLALAAGCGGDNATGSHGDPIFPETVISSSIVEVNPTGGYRARMNWFGWGPEADVDHFDLRVSADSLASAWASVVVTDSVFAIGPEVESQWELSVKAVDTRGYEDPTPAVFTYDIPEER